MARPKDIATKATAASRSKGGHARAEKLHEQREEERRLLSGARRDQLDAAIEKLSAIAEKAAAAIEELLGADSEAVKLRAAIAVLEILDAAELRDMSDRLARLEEIANSNGRPR
jgi:hypothetical protein